MTRAANGGRLAEAARAGNSGRPEKVSGVVKGGKQEDVAGADNGDSSRSRELEGACNVSAVVLVDQERWQRLVMMACQQK